MFTIVTSNRLTSELPIQILTTGQIVSIANYPKNSQFPGNISLLQAFTIWVGLHNQPSVQCSKQCDLLVSARSRGKFLRALQRWTGFGQWQIGTVPEQDGTGRERENCLTVLLKTAPGFSRSSRTDVAAKTTVFYRSIHVKIHSLFPEKTNLTQPYQSVCAIDN